MAGISALGFDLKRGSTSIPNLRSFGTPGVEADEIDVTSSQSAGGFEEVVLGIKRTGEVEFGTFFDPANTVLRALYNDAGDNTAEEWHLLFPTPATGTRQQITFDAYIKSYRPEGDVEGAIEAPLVLRVTGVPVLEDVP